MSVRSIASGAAGLLAGKAIFVLSQWLFIVLLARNGGAVLVGSYGIATAIATPIYMFGKMRLGDLVATDTTGGAVEPYLWLQAYLTIAALPLVLFVGLLVGHDFQFLAVLATIGVGKSIEATSEIVHGVMQREGRASLMGASFAVRGVASLAFAAALFSVRPTLFMAIAGLVVGQTVSSSLLEWRFLRRQYRRPAGHASTAQILLLAFPLGIAGMISALSTNVPRYFLETFTGRDAVGIFTIIMAVAATLPLVNEAISRSTTHLQNAAYRAGRRQVYRLFVLLLGGSAALGAGAIIMSVAFADPFLGTVFGAEFRGHGPLLAIVLLGITAGMMNSHVKRLLMLSRQTRAQLTVTTIALFSGAVIGYLSVPRYGLIGAGWTVAFTMWVELIMGWVLFQPTGS